MFSASNIRVVGKESAEILTTVHRACFPHYWNVDAFNDFFAVQGTYALLAEDPLPAGMMVYRVQKEQADIITIAVLPAHRRKGIAAELMRVAVAHLRALAVESLFLDVEDGNRPATLLYEGMGFSQIRRRKLYYRQKDGSYTDALVMSKKLA